MLLSYVRLKVLIYEGWSNVSQDFINQCVEFMLKMLKAIITGDDKITRYYCNRFYVYNSIGLVVVAVRVLSIAVPWSEFLFTRVLGCQARKIVLAILLMILTRAGTL